MTTWRRNKEGFKEKYDTKIKTENFTNIPIFDILQNTTTKEEKEKVIEGMQCGQFDMFCNDYFQSVGRLKGIPGAQEFGNNFTSLLTYLTDPIYKLDKLLEDSIYNILQTYVNGSLKDCATDKTIKNTALTNVLDVPTFTWLEKFTTMTEGLYVGPTNVENTITNLQNNHPSIDPQKLSTFYVDQLNKRYKDVSGNLTQNDLFEFNVDMDMNQLTDPVVQQKVGAIPTPTPIPIPITYSEYSDYVRFELYSSDPISYYDFNSTYFPMPSAKVPSDSSESSPFSHLQSKLNIDLTGSSDVATTYFRSGKKKPKDPPTDQNINNYAFSVNLSTKKTNTISAYLNNVILYFAFVIVDRDQTATFTDILPKIATVYLTCLNTIEYFKYAKTNQYLSEYEIAVFNHLFYCCLNQTGYTSNVFDSTTNQYINIGTQNFNTGIDVFIRYMSPTIISRVQNISGISSDWYLSTTANEGINSEIITGILPSDCLLSTYISYVQPKTEIITYYKSDFAAYIKLQACKSSNDAILKRFRRYANTIKQEVYRILIIPIVIYLVYNFYYMFLFKDCFGYAKDKSSGETKYDGECKKGGFFPVFPDWEYNFHKLENNRTDFVFEFMFKPVKCLYVFLNAIKTPFHSGELSSLINNVPYLCFLTGFVCIYSIITTYGGALLNSMISLLKLETPKLPIGKWQNSLNDTAAVVTWLSFAKSFYNNMVGDPTAIITNMISNSLGMGSSSPKPSFPSVGWILDSMGSSMIVVIKIIFVILYWILRGVITAAIIPVSIFIMIFYFFFFSIAGMFYYTDNDHSYHDKIELMDRIMYSKLYDLREGELGKNTFKTVCFYAVFLLTEIVILYTLVKNMKTFQNMPMPKKGGPSAIKAARGIQSFMTILTTILIVFLVLWSIFKYFTQKKMLNEMYSLNGGERRLDNFECKEEITVSSNEENEDVNKSDYDKFYTDNQDDILFFNENKDSFMSRIMNSDRLNVTFTKYYAAKTGHIHSRPITQKIMNNLIGVGKYISNTINPPKSYDSIKPEKTGLFGPGGFINQLKETSKKAYDKEKESWNNTNSSNFFGNIDPNKMDFMDGITKMMAVDTTTK